MFNSALLLFLNTAITKHSVTLNQVKYIIKRTYNIKFWYIIDEY